eukprot:COSAG01_NODE_6344_length_3723_cov_68.518212_3_plen_50_part_00
MRTGDCLQMRGVERLGNWALGAMNKAAKQGELHIICMYAHVCSDAVYFT